MIKRILIIALFMTITGIPVLAQTVDWDKGSLGGPVVKRSTSPPTDNSSSRERSGSNNSSSDSSSSGSSGSSQKRDLPPNVVFQNGKYSPAPSFRWLNNKQNDLRVEPIPGAPYYDHPNVVWAENGKARPATGYGWLNKNPKDYRVVGNPGTPYAGHPNVVWVEKGQVLPETGYHWASKTPGLNGDYRVLGNPGTPYAGYPNVMWVQEGQVSPEPGYYWVSPTPGLNGDYRVLPDDGYVEPVVPAERRQEFAEVENRRTGIKNILRAWRARQRELMIQPKTSENMMQFAEIKYQIMNARSQATAINILISDMLRQSPQ